MEDAVGNRKFGCIGYSKKFYVKKEESIMAKVSPAEVEKFLKGVDYPASKADLVKHVQQETQQVLEVLQKLPNETFQRPTDVSKAFGEMERGSKGSS